MEKTINQLYEELLQLPFPKANTNLAFTDWLADLAELDGFYAGLAVSLITGEMVKPQELPRLEPLIQKLEMMNKEAEIKEPLYLQCKEYLSTLQKLAERIRVGTAGTGVT